MTMENMRSVCRQCTSHSGSRFGKNGGRGQVQGELGEALEAGFEAFGVFSRRNIQIESSAPRSNKKSFLITGSKVHYAPSRPFRIEQLMLDVEVDPRARKLWGTCRQQVRVIAAGHSTLVLDQVGLCIEQVRVQQQSVAFEVAEDSVRVSLPLSAATQESDGVFEVEVDYSVFDPKRGLFFTGPHEFQPQKPYQVWSQGQDQDNRYWFPTLDYPNQKVLSEIRVRVPSGFTAVSNGALVERTAQSFHYRLGVPHVTYLISLVVGEFEFWEEPYGPSQLPLQYFVSPGRKEEGVRAFGLTPQMMAVFEEKTGLRYPYEKYSQVAVQDFIFGGMENTSSTTQTDLVLHDARAQLDFSAEPLVSHELAHQWFGNWVTCRDWSQGWLNEGFATFMERVWVECKPQSAVSPQSGVQPHQYQGQEEGKYYALQDLREYLAEDAGSYRRPIVCQSYVEPIDLFDAHLYQKGGLVLNLIRSLLGESGFWKSVQLYLQRHARQTVETLDWIRAIEDATGKNLRQVFDEWVFSAGHPEFEVSYTWNADQKQQEWVIEQKQSSASLLRAESEVSASLFHLPVVLQWALPSGEQGSHTVTLQEVKQRVTLATAQAPCWVRFDPEGAIPKTLKFPRPKALLLEQLVKDPDCLGRIEAAHELVRAGQTGLEQPLGQALRTDAFWGVQVEVAGALAEVRTPEAQEQLLQALALPHPKVRKAVVKALARFPHPKVADALKPLAQADPSYAVEAEATWAWAVVSRVDEAGRGASPAVVDAVESFLLQQFQSKVSYREQIRASALLALAELPGVERGERHRAFQCLRDATSRVHPMEVRLAAIGALGKLAQKAQSSERMQIFEVFERLSEEPLFRLRMKLIPTWVECGDRGAIAALRRIARWDPDGRVKRAAQVGVSELMTSGEVPPVVDSLKQSIEKMELEWAQLKATRPLASRD